VEHLFDEDLPLGMVERNVLGVYELGKGFVDFPMELLVRQGLQAGEVEIFDEFGVDIPLNLMIVVVGMPEGSARGTLLEGTGLIGLAKTAP
jgi:hypothetical protein